MDNNYIEIRLKSLLDKQSQHLGQTRETASQENLIVAKDYLLVLAQRATKEEPSVLL
jgi:hypothetical protein